MIDKDFCLSSYIAFRYIWKDGADFFPGFHHSCYQAIPADQRIPVHTSADIDREIQKQIDVLYEKYDNIGILLSGGMDSANLRNMRRLYGGDVQGKIHLMLEYTDRPGDVADPWFTRDFQATWRDVNEGCRGLLAQLRREYPALG